MRRRLHVTRSLGAPSATLRSALADLADVARRSPGVRGARLLAREVDVEVVELELTAGEAPVVLEVVRLGEDELRFAQVDRFAGRAVAGRVVVAEAATGSGCEVTVELLYPAPLLGGKRRRTLRQALESSIDSLAASAAPADGAVVLRLEADAAGLRVTIDGRRYRLLPVETP
jgi:hypothetical protein